MPTEQELAQQVRIATLMSQVATITQAITEHEAYKEREQKVKDGKDPNE